jgi:SAM-dependent methyltransferase
MREEKLKRLDQAKSSLNDSAYIVYKFLFRDLKKAITDHAKGDVLDIGCGNKPYTEWFKGLTTSYTGCDIIQSDKMLVDVICPATDIPLPAASKDTVFSTQVLEHVADHRKMISEAFRILKPGGKLILSCPMYWEHHEEPYDYFRFTKYGLEYLMSETGFKQWEIIPNGGKWALTGQALLTSIRTSVHKKGFVRTIFKGIYVVFRIKPLINLLFTWLDKKDPDYSTTLNFVVIAEK